MYTYKIIDFGFDYSLEKKIENVHIKEIKSFIGPHCVSLTNFGLYASDDTDLFAFFYKND